MDDPYRLTEAEKQMVADQHGDRVKAGLKPMTDLAAELLAEGEILGVALLLETAQALLHHILEMTQNRQRELEEDVGEDSLRNYMRGVPWK